jgi:hemin uptake protein HemP
MAQSSPPSNELALQPKKKRVTTTELMQGAKEIIVLHRGEQYLLRITKSGKLILTK